MSELQNCQVLLVEPDQSVVEIIHSVLHNTGVGVHTAASGEEALDIFASTSIDIVITELELGGINGIELLKRLALVDHSVKIIVLTNDQTIETELKALSAGAYDYLRKPIPHELLLQRATLRAYESAKLQRQNQELVLTLDTTNEQLVTTKNQLISVNKKFKRLAATDNLTSLYNRRFIEQMLKLETDRRNRYKTALSIAFIDIDSFTQFSTDYGHEISNFVLKDIAQILLKSARTSDMVARFAADVFVVLLPQTPPSNALNFAERARKMVMEEKFETGPKQSMNLTVSVGVSGAESTSESITAKQLTVSASKALHAAKQNGPNKVCSHPEVQFAEPDSNGDEGGIRGNSRAA